MNVCPDTVEPETGQMVTIKQACAGSIDSCVGATRNGFTPIAPDTFSRRGIPGGEDLPERCQDGVSGNTRMRVMPSVC